MEEYELAISRICTNGYNEEDYKVIKKLICNYKDCRNELCYKCGGYKERHNGYCNDCRWRNETL